MGLVSIPPGVYRGRRGDDCWSCDGVARNFFPLGVIVRLTFAMNSSMYSSEICHFIPLPGSSVRRGTLTNALFNDRLWRMEFYVSIATW
jgi:hypothetical protein